MILVQYFQFNIFHKLEFDTIEKCESIKGNFSDKNYCIIHKHLVENVNISQEIIIFTLYPLY